MPTRLQYEKNIEIRELGKVNLENSLIQLESSLNSIRVDQTFQEASTQ